MESRTIGVIGLGNMGGNIARVLHGSGFELVVFDRSEDKRKAIEKLGNAAAADSVADLVRRLKRSGSATIWMMLPAGGATNGTVSELSGLLGKDGIVIDASNSKYEDSMANYDAMKGKGASYLDVGCAGGPDDVLSGVALMVGGDREAYERSKDIFKAVSGTGTYGYVGATGAGQKVKLIHNIIFYGIFPVYAEGVAMLPKLGGVDVTEALRLLKESPPINGSIMAAIEAAFRKGEVPEDAPAIKVSDIVKWGQEKAERLGAELPVTGEILRRYDRISGDSRNIYSGAKKRITGH